MNISYDTWSLIGVWVTVFVTIIALCFKLSPRRIKIKIKSTPFSVGRALERIGQGVNAYDTELVIVNVGQRDVFISEYGLCFKKEHEKLKELSPPKKIGADEPTVETISHRRMLSSLWYDVEKLNYNPTKMLPSPMCQSSDKYEVGRLRYYVKLPTGKIFYSTIRWGQRKITKKQTEEKEASNKLFLK